MSTSDGFDIGLFCSWVETFIFQSEHTTADGSHLVRKRINLVFKEDLYYHQ